MTRWDAARGRQQQAPRRYKPVPPVGKVPPPDDIADQEMRMRTPMMLLLERDFAACSGCGHLQCSCLPKPTPADVRSIVYETLAGKLTVVVDPKHVGSPRFVQPDPLDEAFRKELAKRGGVQEGP